MAEDDAMNCSFLYYMPVSTLFICKSLLLKHYNRANIFGYCLLTENGIQKHLEGYSIKAATTITTEYELLTCIFIDEFS